MIKRDNIYKGYWRSPSTWETSSENEDGCGGHDGEEAEIRRIRRSWAYHEIENNV